MFCPKCGANLVEGAKFCPKCGADLSAYLNESDKPEPEKTETVVQSNSANDTGTPKSQPDTKERKGAIPFSELMKSPIAKFGLICAIIGAIEAIVSMLMCPTSSGGYVSASQHLAISDAFDFWIPFVICGFVLALIGSLIMNLGPMVVGKAKEQKRKSLTAMFMVILAVALAAAVAFAVVRVAIEYADSNESSHASESVDVDRHDNPTDETKLDVTEPESETTVNEEDTDVSEVRDELVIDGIPLSKLIGMTQSEVEEILGESNYYDGSEFEYDNPDDYNDWIVYYTADGTVDGFDGSANHFSFNGQNLKIDKSELIKVLGENYIEGRDTDFNPTCSWPMGDYEIVFVFSYDPDSNGEYLPWEVFSMENRHYDASANAEQDSTNVNPTSVNIAEGIFVDGISAKDLANMSRSEVEAVVGIPDDYGSNYFSYSDDYNDWISYGTESGSISGVSGSANRFTFNGRSLNLVQDELIEVLGSNCEKTFNASWEDFLTWTCKDFVIKFLYDGNTDEKGRDLPIVYLYFGDADIIFDHRIDEISLEDLFGLMGADIENTEWIYGEPPISTYGYGENFYDYNNLVVYYDAYGEIYNIAAVAQDCTYKGYLLKMSAAEFINRFGKPTLLDDNYAEFNDFYNGKNLRIYFDSQQSDIKLLSIYDY